MLECMFGVLMAQFCRHLSSRVLGVNHQSLTHRDFLPEIVWIDQTFNLDVNVDFLHIHWATCIFTTMETIPT